jgi:xanthine/CO dehydrogenase XdhC/CoxF family maturation factor
MNVQDLLTAFRGWRETSTPLALATVFETAGSTYSKTGARMLITDDGRFQGMLSGGCLEGDLAERAAAVCDSGVPETVTYDLGVEPVVPRRVGEDASNVDVVAVIGRDHTDLLTVFGRRGIFDAAPGNDLRALLMSSFRWPFRVAGRWGRRDGFALVLMVW